VDTPDVMKESRDDHDGNEAQKEAPQFHARVKAEAVRQVLEESKTGGQVACELELTETALHTWVERAKADQGQGKPGALTSAEREELATR
jgi:transposase